MSNKNLVLSLTSNILSLIVSVGVVFVLTSYIINNIGKEAYSFYPIANNFVSYMLLISNAINAMSANIITIKIVNNEKETAKSYFSTLVFSNMLISLVLTLISIIVILKLDLIFNIPSELIIDIKFLFSFVFLSMIINLLTSNYSVSIYATNRMELNSLKEIINNILKVILFIVLFKYVGKSIYVVGIVTLLISIFNYSYFYYVCKRLLPEFKPRKKQFDKKKFNHLFKLGIWNTINSLGSILLFTISLAYVNIRIGSVASGTLSILQTLPHFISSIIVVVVSIFTPRFSSIFGKRKDDDLKKEVFFSQKLLSIIVTTVISLLVIYGRSFYQLWLPNENSYELYKLSIFVLIPVIIHGNMWSLTGLNIVKNTIKIPSIMLIISGLINILLYISLDYFNILTLEIVIYITAIISIFYFLLFYITYVERKSNFKKFSLAVVPIKSVVIIIIIHFLTNNVIPNELVFMNNWVDFILYGGITGVVLLLLNTVVILGYKEPINFVKSYLNNSKI